jgi:YD repeat-containing protein
VGGKRQDQPFFLRQICCSSAAYDPLNRLIGTTDPNGGMTGFAYDPLSRLAGVTDPRGLVTSYAYKGLNDLTSLGSPDTGVTAKTYDAAGNALTSTDATATFISGSCRRSLWSIASSWPQAIAVTRAVTISTIWCWIWSGSRRSGIVSASRRHTPTSRSASRSNSAPPLED